MLTVSCVLKTGGPDYTVEYVRKLRDGVARHLSLPHRFVCYSDVDVPCERIALKHDWGANWWAKVEIFSQTSSDYFPQLFMDLDTVCVGPLDLIAEKMSVNFAMLSIKDKGEKNGNSGVMWLGKPFPKVYEKFAAQPSYWMEYHVTHAHGRYAGDQAYISDCFDYIPKLHEFMPGFFKSYKYDRCQQTIPDGCSVVCFGGHPRPHEAGGWVKDVWI